LAKREAAKVSPAKPDITLPLKVKESAFARLINRPWLAIRVLIGKLHFFGNYDGFFDTHAVKLLSSLKLPPSPTGPFGTNRILYVLRRLKRLGLIGSKDLQRGGAAGGMKPFPAARGTAPTLEMQAFGIGPSEQIALKLLVRGAGSEAFQMCLPPC
jgi:hypothetical protein